MITASDLRIGNCIRDIWSSDTACFRVEQLLANSCTYGLHLKAKYCNLIPIPLTEELLLKCGFYHNEKIEYRLHCPEFPITIDIDDFGIQISDSWEFGNIRYLHELQNLYYALTKTELIINL